MFSPAVTSQLPVDARRCRERTVTVVVDNALSPNRSVSLLHVAGGPTIVSLSAARAKEFALSDGECVEDADLSARIERAGVFLHDPDYLFYLALDEQAVLNGETWPAGTRQLTDRDSAVFDEFTAQAPDDELDEAFVELDHWMVFGTFVDDNLVCAASMYPWRGTQLADLGVITLPEFRGRALGRATVRAMSAAALARGYEPQYRCQLDNVASVALARAAGFSLFGEWEVIDAED